MKKKLFTLALVTFLFIAASANEFWLLPEKFFYVVGDTLQIAFKTGSNFIAEPASLKSTSIKKLEFHTTISAVDLKPNVIDNPRTNLSFALVSEGTGVIALQTENQFTETPADEFNAYLKDNGLDDALYTRETTPTALTKPGKENSMHYTKLLVQVGEKKDDTYKKILGWPIEIIPEKNPYTAHVGDLVKFKILSGGKPLFGVKVKVWNRENNRTIIQPVYTQQDGTIEARISNKGPWMVSVIKMTPSTDKKADWQSYKGSLVFGVR